MLKGLTESPTHLKRVESGPNDEKDEGWLQELISENPNLLPVQEFDESFGPLISLGREIETPSGYIDNLFVSPLGRLTLVETKLWKNPEKHRTVVAQVIDYAKEISNWTYDQLKEAVLKASRHEKSEQIQGLEERVKVSLEESGLSLDDFQERVIENLESGEFLLLIVGDRISPNVVLLSEAIGGVPGMNFTIGLIELQLHQLKKGEDWPLLVLPDIVGKTVEKTRGVIKIQYEKERPKVEVSISTEEPTKGTKGKTTQEIFLQKTPDDLRPVYQQWLETWAKERDAIIYWGITGFSFRIRINETVKTVLDAYPNWAVSLLREKDVEFLEAPRELYQKYLDAVNAIPAASQVLASDKKYVKHDSITADDLRTILESTNNFAKGLKAKLR